MKRNKAIVTTMLWIASCSDGSSPSPITVPDFASTYESAWCSWYVRCELARDMETCAEAYSHDLRLVAEGVDAQRIAYDTERAAACLDHMETMGCTSGDVDFDALGSFDLSPECAGVFTGLVADQGECFSTLDCAGGYCDYACDATSECCSGACTPLPVRGGIGAPCTSPADCATGLYCPATLDAVCTRQHTEEGAPCASLSDCARPLVCHLDLGACYRPRAEGEACDPSTVGIEPCALYSNVCDPKSRTCVRAPEPGEACETRCLYGVEFTCSGSGPSAQCVAQERAGEPCSTGTPWTCAGNLRCDSATSTCAERTACDPF